MLVGEGLRALIVFFLKLSLLLFFARVIFFFTVAYADDFGIYVLLDCSPCITYCKCFLFDEDAS